MKELLDLADDLLLIVLGVPDEAADVRREVLDNRFMAAAYGRCHVPSQEACDTLVLGV